MKEQFKTVNVGTFSELINLRQRFENFGVWTFLTEKTNKNNTLTVINCCYFAEEWMFQRSNAIEGWWLWLPFTLWWKAHMCPISNLTVRSFVVAFFPDSCSCVGDVDQL